MTPRFDRIPSELRELSNWVCWKREQRTNKRGEVHTSKVPYNSASGKHAQSNNPGTWSSFESAKAAYERGGFDGIGFCLSRTINSDSQFVGVDLDNCRPDGKTDEPWAEEIIRELNSYTEVSPSGCGIRIIVRGELPPGGRQKEFEGREHYGVGLYDAQNGRFLTLTGAAINGNVIEERTAELQRIHERLFPPKPTAQTQAKSDTDIGDNALIELAKKAKDGGRFARLWAGEWQGDYQSQSEGDLALCLKLVFWFGHDAARIDAMFRKSGLYRDKWNDRPDYRETTIQKALDRQTETYHPPKPRKESATTHTLEVDLSLAIPTIELLNSVPIFGGRIKFTSIYRRGTLIQAEFADGNKATWPTATDLRTFARSQDILFSSTGILLVTPPQKEIKTTWEPIAQLIRSLADQNATDVPPPLEDEFAQILRSTWERAGRPKTETREEFFEMLCHCQKCPRDPAALVPPTCAVWIGGAGEQAEQFIWVHLDVLQAWLSTPAAKSKHYLWDDLRTALLMLDFTPRELHRSFGDAKVHVRIWRAVIDLLVDDDTLEDTEL
jgi:hypothetical protein